MSKSPQIMKPDVKLDGRSFQFKERRFLVTKKPSSKRTKTMSQAANLKQVIYCLLITKEKNSGY